MTHHDQQAATTIDPEPDRRHSINLRGHRTLDVMWAMAGEELTLRDIAAEIGSDNPYTTIRDIVNKLKRRGMVRKVTQERPLKPGETAARTLWCATAEGELALAAELARGRVPGKPARVRTPTTMRAWVVKLLARGKPLTTEELWELSGRFRSKGRVQLEINRLVASGHAVIVQPQRRGGVRGSTPAVYQRAEVTRG